MEEYKKHKYEHLRKKYDPTWKQLDPLPNIGHPIETACNKNVKSNTNVDKMFKTLIVLILLALYAYGTFFRSMFC